MNQPNPITRRASAVLARPLPGPQSVTVSFSVWEAQQVRVVANGGGGPQDQPYIAVTVGDALTYVYDQVGLACHVTAWREAAGLNGAVRLPARSCAAPQARHDLSVLCHTVGWQRVSVVGEHPSDATPAAISVVVGAVTVRVHTSEALRCYVDAWTRAERLGAVLDPPAVHARGLSTAQRFGWAGPAAAGHAAVMLTSAYVIRDFHLSDLPPLAYADDLETAKATVERLHAQFFDQLDANGEGATGARQTLSVTSCADGQVRYISGAFGYGR